MTTQVETAYAARLKAGDLKADPAQTAGVAALARLERDLKAAAWPFGGRKVQGLYLYGPPGRGKSMLMDLFFATAPVKAKRRLHFHAFMAEVHDLIRTWRGGDASARKARFGRTDGDDPIAPAAEVIAKSAKLLCFDELQVTDIADAMILGRLFEALFRHGVTLVATSNRAPETLYKNGVNRQLFLPFIDMLKARCAVVEIAGVHDFRRDRLRAAQTYLSPITAEAKSAFDALWRDVIGGDAEVPATLDVFGRKLTFARTVSSLARIGFKDLCAVALGPNDYLAVAARFQTLFLENVPKLDPTNREEARRFVILIDALYEAHARVIVLAEAEPNQLYVSGDGAFEFERTASRLEEMRSQDYR